MVTLNVGQYRIEITNDSVHSDGSADNVHTYDRTYRFGDDAYQATSRHAIRVTFDDELVGSCLLSADGGASGVHDHMAIQHNDVCFIAVGPFIAALDVQSLKLKWVRQTDDATCFGVYNSAKHNCLLSHGEIEIARVTYDGKIVWQAGGADIFTNGFELQDDVVRVFDFEDREYVIYIETGRETAA